MQPISQPANNHPQFPSIWKRIGVNLTNLPRKTIYLIKTLALKIFNLPWVFCRALFSITKPKPPQDGPRGGDSQEVGPGSGGNRGNGLPGLPGQQPGQQPGQSIRSGFEIEAGVLENESNGRILEKILLKEQEVTRNVKFSEDCFVSSMKEHKLDVINKAKDDLTKNKFAIDRLANNLIYNSYYSHRSNKQILEYCIIPAVNLKQDPDYGSYQKIVASDYYEQGCMEVLTTDEGKKYFLEIFHLYHSSSYLNLSLASSLLDERWNKILKNFCQDCLDNNKIGGLLPLKVRNKEDQITLGARLHYLTELPPVAEEKLNTELPPGSEEKLNNQSIIEEAFKALSAQCYTSNHLDTVTKFFDSVKSRLDRDTASKLQLCLSEQAQNVAEWELLRYFYYFLAPANIWDDLRSHRDFFEGKSSADLTLTSLQNYINNKLDNVAKYESSSIDIRRIKIFREIIINSETYPLPTSSNGIKILFTNVIDTLKRLQNSKLITNLKICNFKDKGAVQCTFHV